MDTNMSMDSNMSGGNTTNTTTTTTTTNTTNTH
jgi:hypothetical protein